MFHRVSCSARRVSCCFVWCVDRLGVFHRVSVLLPQDCRGLFVGHISECLMFTGNADPFVLV